MTTKYGYRNGILTFYEPSQKHERTIVAAPFEIIDDFEGTVIQTVAAGVKGWTIKDTSAAGDALPVIVANQSGGVVSLHLDGGQNEKEESGLYLGDALNFNVDKGPIIEFVAAVHTAPTLQSELYFGLANAYVEGPIAEADAGPTIHALFMFDGGLVCTLHSDDTANDNNAIATGVTVVADILHVFRVDMTTPADVLFYIDGARVGSATTFDMSTGANVMLQPFMMAHKETGLGVGTLYVDKVHVWQPKR